jgi:hypothetical protein
VTDNTGAPLEGVRVTVRREGWRDPGDASVSYPTAGTNDLGEYEFSRLAPGRYQVFVPASHVTWAVNARRPQMIFADAPRNASAITSDDGRFSWVPAIRASPTPLGDGRDTVFVTTGYPGTGDPTSFTTFTLDAGAERGNIDIVMRTEPRVRVRGVAVGPAGPLAHVHVRLRRDGLRPEELVQATGHADGRFEFLSVPPGSYELDAYRVLGESDTFLPDPNGYWSRTPLTVGDRDIDGLTVRMTPGAVVHARIESGDQPSLSGGSVSLVPMRMYTLGGGGGVQRWTPRSFEAKGLAPGDYLWSIGGGRSNWSLASIVRGGRDITGEPLRVDSADIDDVVITIAGPPSGVRGSVAPPGGTSVELYSVVLFPVDPRKRGTAWPRETLVRSVNLPPEGTYRFDGLPPGRYVVAAVDEATMDAWPAPALFERIAAEAETIALTTNQVVTKDLVVRR